MSYARPSYDAADATWVGASEYTRQPYNEANASFQETNTPTTSFALEVFVISFPISPDTQSLALVSYEPRLVIDPVDCVLSVLPLKKYQLRTLCWLYSLRHLIRFICLYPLSFASLPLYPG